MNSEWLQLILYMLRLGDHPKPWSGPLRNYYVSDKEATCKYLLNCGRFTAKQVEELSQILGITVVAKIHGVYFAITKGHVMRMNNPRVIRRGPDFWDYEYFSLVWNRRYRCRLTCDKNGEGYWISGSNPIKGYRERFRPIGATEFQDRTAGITYNQDGLPIETPPDHKAIRAMWKRVHRD